jgi:hypothetical protein
MNLGNLPMKVNFFSTLDAAIQWINTPIEDAQLVEETLKIMRNAEAE